MLGGPQAQLSQPTLTQTFPLSPWLALLDRGVPASGLTTHRLSAHILYTGGAPASLSSLLMGSPTISGPSLPNSLAGALRPGLAESSPWAVRIVCLLLRGSSGPLVFSQKPWSLGPSCGCRGRHSSCPFSGTPLALAAVPNWYLCSHLWWLDLVLNSEFLEECEQCLSHTRARAQPFL